MKHKLVKSINNEYYIGDIVTLHFENDINKIRRTYVGRIMDISQSYITLDCSYNYNSRIEEISFVYIKNILKGNRREG